MLYYLNQPKEVKVQLILRKLNLNKLLIIIVLKQIIQEIQLLQLQPTKQLVQTFNTIFKIKITQQLLNITNTETDNLLI